MQTLVPTDEELLLRDTVRRIGSRYGRRYYVEKAARRERMDELGGACS